MIQIPATLNPKRATSTVANISNVCGEIYDKLVSYCNIMTFVLPVQNTFGASVYTLRSFFNKKTSQQYLSDLYNEPRRGKHKAVWAKT